MSIDVKRKGNYETFKTTEGHKILVLDRKDYYAWIDTAKGHLLVQSDGDHTKAKTLSEGEYVFVIPHNEPFMKDDIGHLELKEDGQFHTYILPRGLPDKNDEQKKLVYTKEYLSQNKVNEWLH